MRLTLGIHALFITIYAANAFLQATHEVAISRTVNSRRLPKVLMMHQHQHISPSSDGKKKPMIVVGNPSAALGAALALCSMDVLRKNEGFDKPLPPAQLLAFFNAKQEESISKDMEHYLQTCLLFGQYASSDTIQGFPSVNDYQDMFGNIDEFLSKIYADSTKYDKPILHTSLNDFSKMTLETIQSLTDPKIRNNISFLGIHAKGKANESKSSDFILSKDEAIILGKGINEVLNYSPGGQHSPKAAVISNLPTHLAMLHANSLPKSKDILDDLWIVHNDMKDSSSLLFEYQFDYNNPMGGIDPLLCPSYGYKISSPAEHIHSVSNDLLSRSNDAFAAAYSAMVGSGMDPLSSLCVATSIKAVFIESDSKDRSITFSSPSFTWETVVKVADYSRKVRQTIQREDGKSRIMYKEFGYK